MSNKINDLRAHYRNCIIHAFGGMLCVINSDEDFKKYWRKAEEIILRDYEDPQVKILPVECDYPWFQQTEFGTCFMLSCFATILTVLVELAKHGLIKSDKQLKEFFSEVEIKFLELLKDDDILFRKLYEIDKRLDEIKWGQHANCEVV